MKLSAKADQDYISMKKLFYLAIFVFVIVDLSTASESIRIAAIFSQTGEASSISDEHLITVRFAVDEINNNGGILGKRIELIELDNKSTALGSRQAAIRAVNEKVVAVLGSSWSSHALGMALVLQEAGIPMLTPTATNPKVTEVGDFIFRTCFIDTFQGEVLANFAYNYLKARHVAILTNTDQIFSIELAKQFYYSFNSLNGKIVAELDYVENMTNYGDLINKLMQYNFDAVFLPGYTRDSALIIKRARALGLDSVFLGGDGWSHLMYNYAPESLNNTYYLTHWHASQSDKRSIAFLNKIKTLYSDEEINAGMALAYDMVYLLADAIERAHSTDRDRIRDALASTTAFIGVTGKIKYDKNRNPIKPAVIVKFENGSSISVKRVEP